MKIEEIVISKLKSHPKNYNSHPEEELLHIVESIKNYGFYKNIVVANDYTILAGHGVVEAAKKMNYKKVPIIRLAIPFDDPKALKLLIGDNEIRHLAKIDDYGLTDLLKELKDTEDLLGTGYDEMMLANLLYITRPETEIEDFDAAKEWLGMPDYEEGKRVFRILVLCETLDLKNEFLKNNNYVTSEKQLDSVWFPPKKRQILKDKSFQ